MRKFLRLLSLMFTFIILLTGCGGSDVDTEEVVDNLKLERILNVDVNNSTVQMSPVGIEKLYKNRKDLSKYVKFNVSRNVIKATYDDNNSKINIKVKNGNNYKDYVIKVKENKYQYTSEFCENFLLAAEKDAKNAEDGCIALVGDSLFDFWPWPAIDLDNDKVVNLGIGGFSVSDIIDYTFPRLVQPLNPTKILIHVGVNDIFQAGQSLDTYAINIQKLVLLIEKYYGDIQIIFISIVRPTDQAPTGMGITGSVADSRRDLIDDANELLRDYCGEKDNLIYVDAQNAYLDNNNRSDPDKFQKDGIHIRNDVYPNWGEIIKNYI